MKQSMPAMRAFRLPKKPSLRCQLRDGKGHHLQVSKLNPLPTLLSSILDLLNKLAPLLPNKVCQRLHARYAGIFVIADIRVV